jgi:hypothetical protein
LFLGVHAQQRILWHQNVELPDFLLLLKNQPSLSMMSDSSLLALLKKLSLQLELRKAHLSMMVPLIQDAIDEL